MKANNSIDDNYEILLIGKTGDGKSSLGNFLLNDGKEHFKVYHESKSGTQKTMIEKVGNLTIIDTPGLLDSENRGGEKDKDAEHYKEMITIIKEMKNLKGIIITKESNNIRFSSDIQEMIKMICNSFDDPKIFKNVSFTFTKFYMKKKQKEEIKVVGKGFIDKAKKLIVDFYGKNKIKDLQYSFPYFFIDSDLDDPDEESKKERLKIYEWATGLTKINPEKIPIKDPNYRETYHDSDTDIKVDEDDDYIYKTTIFYTFTYAIDLNGKRVDFNDKKEQQRITTKIPKKKPLWKKILGGIAIGGGIIAAPFTGGASLAISGAGTALAIDATIDDSHNEENRKK